MADANTEVSGVDTQEQHQETNEGQGAQTTQEGRFKSVEDAVAELAKLEKNLENSRKAEKHAKAELKRLQDASTNASELESKYNEAVEKLTAAEGKYRDRLINEALNKALAEAKAKSPSIVMKLIDRTAIKVENDEVDASSVEAVLAALKKDDTDGVLFELVETPDVKRSTEGAVVGGFDKEIRAAKTQKEIEAVMKKYGKA